MTKIKWLLKGKPYISYKGFTCGICGRWRDMPLKIPAYKSLGQWRDTWGLCPDTCGEKHEKDD